SVTVNGDLVQEPDETVLISLYLPKNATLQDTQGSVTILDDDSDTSVGLQASVGDFSVQASTTNGVHYAYLPVTLSRPAPSKVTVYYSISCTGRDAVSGLDYIYGSTGVLTFLTGQQTKQLTFQILPNQTDDEVKTILETITVSPGPAAVDDPAGAATIVDG